MHALLYWVSMALLLTGCASAGDESISGVALLAQNLVDDDKEPAPEVSANPTEPQQGLRHLALTGGRVLRGDRVLRILDVRDPQHPRIEGELNDYVVADGLFFRIGNHAVFRGVEAYHYRGEREDIPLPRARSWALLNVDFSDYKKPKLVNKLAFRNLNGSGRLVQGQGQTGSAIYLIEYRNRQEDAAYILRYELQDEQLVLTGELELKEDVEKFETVGSRVLLSFRTFNGPGSIAVVDGSGPDLQTVYEASVPGPYYNVQALVVDGPKLRVAYSRYSTAGDTIASIDTFDLTKDDALGKVGRCDIKPRDPEFGAYFDGTLYSKRDHSLFAGDDNQSLTYQIPFDTAGKCPRRRVLGTGGSRAFQIPAPQRLFALNANELRLFNTGRYVTVPLLASAPLEHFYYYTDAARPIQVLGLEHAATAADGTPEPWLVGLPYWDEYSGVAEGAFQLFTASPRTLTPRSTIFELAGTGDLALFGSTLVTLSSEGLRTFDVRDVGAPKQLGSLELDVPFSGEYHFGDYVARIRTAPLSGPPTEIEPLQELLIVRLDAVGETPVASWRIRRSSLWLKAEDLLLEVRWIFTNSQLSPYLTVQVYDLSDPSRPRKAGVFFSDEIRPRFPVTSDPQLHYRVVGRSLAIAQRQQGAAPEEGPWSILRVIDFKDPDEPQLETYPQVHPDADFSSLSSGVQVGTWVYYSQQKEDGLYGTLIDFENPYAPSVSSASPIPAPIQAATPDAVYSATPSSSPLDLTVYRLLYNGTFLPPTAARTWPGRTLASIRADGGQYVYLTHAPHPDASPGTGPHSDWARLEVLDATTLETVGVLDIDTQGNIKDSANGRLFIAIPNALLFVDVRDPAHPTPRAAVPFSSDAQVVANGKLIHVSTDRVQSYPIDLQNLRP